MAEEKTIVIFRKYPEGDILAIFPEIPSDAWGYECTVYQHLGQHGGGDCRGMMLATKPAKPSEYKALKKELEQIGYVLEVRERMTEEMRNRRIADANRQRQAVTPRHEEPGQLRLFGMAASKGGGYHVMTYGGDRYTSIAWYPTRAEAEDHVQHLLDTGGWRGMPPRVEPSR